jgi:hypothetical protein
MSAPIFVKVEMTVLFQDLSFAESYYQEADEIDVDTDSDDESSECDQMKRREKRRLIAHGEELDSEDIPNADEIFGFLCSSDCGESKPRYIEMIEDVACFKSFHYPAIYLDDNHVKISFVTRLDTTDWESEWDMERSINDSPFFKSRTGGHVGNYCKFPSRVYPEDQLGELEIAADVVRVTDFTGDTVWVDVETDDEKTADVSEDESEEEPTAVRHPYYMTHEELFGMKDVDLDLDAPMQAPTQARKKGWGFLFKPKRVLRRFF